MNKFNTKYYKKVKENFVNKNNEEAWKEKAGEKGDWKNAWCDYCLRRLVGKRKKSRMVEDKHLMAFWNGDEKETNFICNTCLAYLGWTRTLYKEKPRFFTYLGGKGLYHGWIEEWGDENKFKKIEGKLQKVEEIDKYNDYYVFLLAIDGQEIYFRHRERFPFALLKKKEGSEAVILCKLTEESLEMRKIFSVETSQIEKEKKPIKFKDKHQNNLLISEEKEIKERLQKLEEELSSLKSALKSVFS